MFKNIFKIILSAAGIIILSTPVFAATTVLFSPQNIVVEEEKHFTLRLLVYPHGVENYTAMIQVRYPEDLLEAEDFVFADGWMAVLQQGYDGIDNANGVLIKTAGYPGGISEPQIFGTISFLGKKTGDGIVRVGGYSVVFDKSNQNVLVVPLGETTVSIKKEGFTPEEEVIPEDEEIIPPEEEVIPEDEKIVSPEEEIISVPLFDISVEPAAKKSEKIETIYLLVAIGMIFSVIVIVFIIISYIIDRKKEKKMYNEEKKN